MAKLTVLFPFFEWVAEKRRSGKRKRRRRRRQLIPTPPHDIITHVGSCQSPTPYRSTWQGVSRKACSYLWRGTACMASPRFHVLRVMAESVRNMWPGPTTKLWGDAPLTIPGNAEQQASGRSKAPVALLTPVLVVKHPIKLGESYQHFCLLVHLLSPTVPSPLSLTSPPLTAAHRVLL